MPPLPQNQPSAPPSGLDPTLVNLSRSIRDVESGGDFTSVGKSGEYGAYQFEPTTWNATAPRFGVNVPLEQATPTQQNQVAYMQLAEWKQQHPDWNVGNFASAWNAGPGKPDAYLGGNSGVNSYGVSYDTGAYAQKVAQAYQSYKTQATDPSAEGGIPSPYATNTYGATFPASPDDNALTAALKAAGNLPSSTANFVGGLVNTAMHPLQTLETLGRGAIGGAENLTGQNPGAPDANQQTANAIGQAFLDRYGSLDKARQSAENDPFGVGTDIASLLAGGAGLLGKGAEAADLASSAVRPITGAVEGTLGRAGAPFAGSIDETVAGAANKLGVTLPATSVSSSPIVQGLDTIASKGIGGEAYLTRVTKATDDLNTAAETIAKAAGGTDDLIEAGQNVVKGFDAYKKAFFKQNDEVYNALEQSAGDVAAQTQSSVKVLQDIIAQKEAIGDTKDLGWFKQKLAVITGAKAPAGESDFITLDEKGKPLFPAMKQYPPPTFSTLKKLRTAIGQLQGKKFQSEFVSTNDAQIQQFYGALSQDMGSTLKATGDTNLYSLWQKANQDYTNGIKLINSSYGKTIKRLADAGQYDKIISSIVKPSMSAADIQKIFKVVGPQGVKEIQGALLKKIFSDAQVENADGVLQFKTKGIATQIQRYKLGDENKLAQILTPEQYQGLQDMQTVAASLSRGQLLVRGGGLVNAMRTYGELGAVGYAALNLMQGDVIGAVQKLGLIGLEQGASYFLASDTGQKLLTFGLRSGDIAKAAINDLGLQDKVNNGTGVPNGTYSSSNGVGDVGGSGGVPPVPGASGPGAAAPASDTGSVNRVGAPDGTGTGDIATKAAELTKANGGVTINLNGDIPTAGHAFAPSKTTESVTPLAEYTPETTMAFMKANAELLNKEGNYLGQWVDGDKVYLDVSTVEPDFAKAMDLAKQSDQIAVFNLSDFTTHNLADYEKTGSTYTRTGEDAGASSGATGPDNAGEGSIEEQIKAFPRDTSLKGKGAQLQEAGIDYYVRNKADLLKQYLEQNGKTVNTDEARKLFAPVGYNGANSAAFQEAASQLSKDALSSIIKTSPKGVGVFTAGGSGAGKSSLIRELGDAEGVSFIVDGNASNYDSLTKKIDEAKAAGHTPRIVYLYRDPEEAWNNGVISRMLTSSTDKGRVVPLKEFLKNTSGSLAAAKQAVTDGIEVKAYENVAGGGRVELTPDEVKAIKLPGTLQKRLVRDTEALAKEGKIKKRQFNALLHDITHEDYDVLRDEA